MTDLKIWTKAHRAWVDEFVLTLRDQDVPGAVIGDRLAQAHAHCDAAGAFPEEEFGPARAYAESLGLGAPVGRRESRSGILAAFLPILAQVMLMLVGAYAVRGWIEGGDLVLNTGTLVCWALLAAVLVVLAVLATTRLRLVLNLWVFLGFNVLGVLLGIAGAAFASADLPEVVRMSPIPAAIVCCAAVLLIAVVMTVRTLRTPREDPDLLGDPRETPATGRQPSGRATAALPYWLIPAYLVVDAVITQMTLG